MENEILIDGALKRELSGIYGAAGRHYHNLSHIEAMLALALEYRSALADPEAVEAAIWLHDAVYDSRAKDNEAQSAALARQRLNERTTRARIDNVAAMIEATATHRLPHSADAAFLRDTALFLDMDLSILGAAPGIFDAYEMAVRREYEWVPEPAWIAGRGAELKSFLGHAHIFHTQEFRSRFESQARQNVERSLAMLAYPPHGG